MLVQKKAVRVQAWQLGAGTKKEDELIRCGKIRRCADGNYELFSLEAPGEKGQIAKPGDYFKVALSGEPYPNEKEWFEQRHTHIRDEWYMQRACPISAWTDGDPLNDAIRFLLNHGQLQIHTGDNAGYYSAALWGTTERAAKDAVILIHHVGRNEQNEITDVTFNFVKRSEFDKTYSVLSGT